MILEHIYSYEMVPCHSILVTSYFMDASKFIVVYLIRKTNLRNKRSYIGTFLITM